MPRVLLEGSLDHLVTPTHSDARGPVVRGKSIEVMKMHWRAGDSARPHQHPEEQAIYVISGRMRMTCGDETYEIGPGEVSYHPSNVALLTCLHGKRPKDRSIWNLTTLTLGRYMIHHRFGVW